MSPAVVFFAITNTYSTAVTQEQKIRRPHVDTGGIVKS